MDPNDDSVTGITRYLVYKKRKQNEFFKEVAKIQFSSSEKMDPSDFIKQLTEDFFPMDIKNQIISDLINKKRVEEESLKTFKVKTGKDGSLKLKVK